MMRVTFNAVTNSACVLSRHERCAALGKAIQNNRVASRAVQNRVYDHRQRLYGRMFQFEVAMTAEARRFRIVPDIGAIAAKTSKRNVVNMRTGAVFENAYKLVLRAIKAPRAGIRFRPHTDIFQLCVDAFGHIQDIVDVPPIDAYEVY